MTIHILAYAKLNLSLRVLGRRPDGYHDILSEVQTIDLADRLAIDLDSEDVRVDNDLVPQGSDIVEQAATVLLAHKRRDQGAAIRIEKSIPIGAGLGGGSSDAAAVLCVLDRQTPPTLPFEVLCDIASDIGSDVPLFLHGGLIHMSGRGEYVEQLPKEPEKHFVVLVPEIHCATARIYAHWDEVGGAQCAMQNTELMRGENDLLKAALAVHPALAPYHEAISSLDATYYGMSGSGSSFYAAFEHRDAANLAHRRLTRQFESAKVFVCRPTNSGHRMWEMR